MPGDIVDTGLHDQFGEQLTQRDDDITVREVFARRYGQDGIAFKKLLIHSPTTGGSAFRLTFAPRITHLFFYDASASAGARWIDLLNASPNLIDRVGTGSTGTTLDSWAVADFLYVGTRRPNGGLAIDMLDASINAGSASTMTMAYGKNDGTFASTAITDTTVTASVTLAKDGLILIDTVPTDWANQTLADLGLTDVDTPGGSAYWSRFDASVVMDSDVEISEILAFHKTTTEAPGESSSGAGGFYNLNESYTVPIGDWGGLEILEQGGVGSKIVNLTWLAS